MSSLELWTELPKNVRYEFRAVDGMEMQFALIGDDYVIPVMPSDEVTSPYLITDVSGIPVKVIEPAQIG